MRAKVEFGEDVGDVLADGRGRHHQLIGDLGIGSAIRHQREHFGAGSGDPLLRIFSDDLRTGTLLTLGIAFLVAAASTLLNQASAVLDRRQEFRQLGNLGAPRVLHDQARRVEVVAPAVLSAAGSGGLAVFFFGLVPGAAFATNPIGLLAFAGAVLGGIALVWLAGEACRPLVRQALADR